MRTVLFRRPWVAAAVAAAAVTLAVPALASAQDPTPTSTIPAEGAADARHEQLATALAEELELPAEEVAAALEAVGERLREQRRAAQRAALQQRLDDAVAAGELTQEQADAVLAATDAGVLPGAGHDLGARGSGPFGPGGPRHGR